MPELPMEGFATVACAECGRSPERGEVWRVYLADIGEAVTYCPDCAEREFGDHRRTVKAGASNP